MTKLNSDSVLQNRDITFNKSSYSQSCGFSSNQVRMWELDHKEGLSRRIDAFKQWCLRRLLRVPWTARRSNMSTLKEISPEYSLEGLTLKVKLQYFGHLMQRADSLEKTLMLGIIEGNSRRGQQRMRWLDSITDSIDMNLSKPIKIVKEGKPGVLKSMESQRVGHTLETEWQSQVRDVCDIAGNHFLT